MTEPVFNQRPVRFEDTPNYAAERDAAIDQFMSELDAVEAETGITPGSSMSAYAEYVEQIAVDLYLLRVAAGLEEFFDEGEAPFTIVTAAPDSAETGSNFDFADSGVEL